MSNDNLEHILAKTGDRVSFSNDVPNATIIAIHEDACCVAWDGGGVATRRLDQITTTTYSDKNPIYYSNIPEGATRVYASICRSCGVGAVIMFDREKKTVCIGCEEG